MEKLSQVKVSYSIEITESGIQAYAEWMQIEVESDEQIRVWIHDTLRDIGTQRFWRMVRAGERILRARNAHNLDQ